MQFTVAVTGSLYPPNGGKIPAIGRPFYYKILVVLFCGSCPGNQYYIAFRLCGKLKQRYRQWGCNGERKPGIYRQVISVYFRTRFGMNINQPYFLCVSIVAYIKSGHVR